MTRLLTRRGFFGVILLLVSALLLSGCTPLILPESWAGITPDGNMGADGRYEARYLYIAYRDTIFRVDTQTFPESRPTERLIDWAARGNRLFTRPILGADNLIYVGSYGHQLYAFSPSANPREANVPSFAPTPGAVALIADPVYYNGAVYQGLGDKGISVLDAKTGALRTAFMDTKNGLWAAPLIDEANNILYFAAMDQNLYALTADTMTLLWKIPLEGAVGATPLLADGIMYVGTFNSEVIAVDVSKDQPEILRRFKTKGWVWSTPVLSEGVLYFGDMSGAVYALNSADFSPKWQGQVEGAARGRVAVVEDKVIAAGEQRYLKAFNRESGALMWTSSPPTDDRILGDLVVIGQEVIVTTLSENQLVVAFNLATGGRAWFVRKPTGDDFARLTLTPSQR